MTKRALPLWKRKEEKQRYEVTTNTTYWKHHIKKQMLLALKMIDIWLRCFRFHWIFIFVIRYSKTASKTGRCTNICISTAYILYNLYSGSTCIHKISIRNWTIIKRALPMRKRKEEKQRYEVTTNTKYWKHHIKSKCYSP